MCRISFFILTQMWTSAEISRNLQAFSVEVDFCVRSFSPYRREGHAKISFGLCNSHSVLSVSLGKLILTECVIFPDETSSLQNFQK